MKANIVLLLLILISMSISAQDRPNDFYVSKRGDTVLGTYVYGAKYDGFKNLKGEKIKLKPDSILSYSIFLENNNRSKNDPYFFTRTWINIRDSFYEAVYMETGPVGVVIQETRRYTDVLRIVPDHSDSYLFVRDGKMTKFLSISFYSAAKKYLADCPTIIDLLEHVPNEKNRTKTHKATFEDVAFIISKYNECMKR